jgi:hypothetical protein
MTATGSPGVPSPEVLPPLRGRGGRFVEPVVLLVALVVTVLLVVVLVLRVGDASRSEQLASARSHSLTMASSGAAALLSYDYRTIGDLVAKNRPCARGSGGGSR